MDIVPQTKSGFLDILLTPLRGVIQPIYDSYRKREPFTLSMVIPAWAVSEMPGTPIPYTTEHRYDFGNGGVYGPPDMPVRMGVVNVAQTVQVQKVMTPREIEYVQEFYNGPQENMELFVYSPFSLPTTLPCSTSMLKY